MEKIVNFQTSLFGSFINIKPRTAVVLSLLNNLKDESFIPVYREQLIYCL